MSFLKFFSCMSICFFLIDANFIDSPLIHKYKSSKKSSSATTNFIFSDRNRPEPHNLTFPQ